MGFSSVLHCGPHFEESYKDDALPICQSSLMFPKMPVASRRAGAGGCQMSVYSGSNNLLAAAKRNMQTYGSPHHLHEQSFGSKACQARRLSCSGGADPDSGSALQSSGRHGHRVQERGFAPARP